MRDAPNKTPVKTGKARSSSTMGGAATVNGAPAGKTARDSAAQTDTSSAALRAFAVLETLVSADRPLSLSEIVEAQHLPKPTVFRVLATLESAGLVLREPVEKFYSVGPRLSRLGLDVMMNNSVRRQRRAILQAVADETRETCNLTMMDGAEVIYVDRVESEWPLRIDLKPGSKVPLHCSASGKLFLSQLPRAKRRAVLECLSLKRFTDHTITDLDMLEAELDRIRVSEVSLDNEEYVAGLVCIAVPVLDGQGRNVASIAVQAPVARLSATRALQYVPVLRRAASAMTATFAFATDENATKPREPAASARRGAVAEHAAD